MGNQVIFTPTYISMNSMINDDKRWKESSILLDVRDVFGSIMCDFEGVKSLEERNILQRVWPCRLVFDILVASKPITIVIIGEISSKLMKWTFISSKVIESRGSRSRRNRIAIYFIDFASSLHSTLKIISNRVNSRIKHICCTHNIE